MKKSIKIAVLFTLALLCHGCDGGEGRDTSRTDCDPSDYPVTFTAVNETDCEITLFRNGLSGQDTVVAVWGAGESVLLAEDEQVGDCNGDLLPDLYPDREYPFFSRWGVNDDAIRYLTGYGFALTLDGQKIPDEIWKRKYWSYTPDHYRWSYTLTVTDELLDGLLE